jgi:hypothetical protein
MRAADLTLLRIRGRAVGCRIARGSRLRRPALPLAEPGGAVHILGRPSLLAAGEPSRLVDVENGDDEQDRDAASRVGNVALLRTGSSE